jgi:hypothetical protein
LQFDRVLAAFELAKDGRGRRAYVTYLEERAASDGGNLSDAAMAALRTGWYLGDETFRDRLLGLMKKGSKLLRIKGSHAPAVIKRHGEGEAERIVARGMVEVGLLDETGQPILTHKGDPRKVALASVLKAHTSVDNEWISQRLAMGHNRSVRRLIRQGNDNPEIKRLCSKLLRMLPCED